MAKNDKTQDQAQDDAQKSVAIPEQASTGYTQDEAVAGRGKYLKMLADNKDVAKKYGEPDFQSLLEKIGSDGAFAKQFVLAEIAKHDEAQPVGTPVLPDAPQELNITGKLDNTGNTAVKVTTDATTDLPATAAVESN